MMMAFQSYLIIGYDKINASIFGFLEPGLPKFYRWELCGVAIVNSVLSYSFEKLVISFRTFKPKTKPGTR